MALQSLMQRAVEYRQRENPEKFFMVPGGGLFADRVRELYNSKSITDESAHWMAIKATEMSGLMMRNSFAKLHPFSRLEEFESIWAKGGIPAFFPFEMAYNLDELPHSWKVTSDSIAYWAGIHAGARFVFLIKDVDGIHQGCNIEDFCDTPIYPELTPAELKEIQASWNIEEKTAKYYAVDPYLPELMEKTDAAIPCIMINYDKMDLIPKIVNGEKVSPCTIIRKK